MSKKNPSTKKKKVSAGIIGAIVVFFVLVAIGSRLKDSQQIPEPYGIEMGIMWGSTFVTFFMVWILYFAYFVLQGSTHAEWERGYRLLSRYYIYQAKTYLDYHLKQSSTRNKERERRSTKTELLIPTYKDRIEQIGAGVVPTHYVLALDSPSGFSRAVGPGVVILAGKFVKKTESVSLTLDMRPHLRQERVEAITNDGIEIKTDVIVTFHINRAEQHIVMPEPDEGDGAVQTEQKTLLYPYDEADIRHIRYASSIDAKLNVSQWNDHIAPLAATLLADELSSRTLEQLHDVNSFVLQEIRAVVQERLERRLNSTLSTDDEGNEIEEYKNSGITITAVNLTPIEEPEVVQEQRLALWKMGIEEQINAQKLSQKAQSTKDIQNMRAAAQIEIVNNIIESIQSMYDAKNINLAEIVTLRMVAALEEGMKNEALLNMTPQTMTHWVTDSIKQLHTLLEDGT